VSNLHRTPAGGVAPLQYVWHWRATPGRPIARKGQPCRLLVRSRRMNSCLVEFADGFRVVTSRNALRRRR